MGERALHTGIAMVLINETLSVAFIGDLAARCQHPAVQHVLNATLADEDGHEAFGLAYVRASLGRFPESTLPAWRGLVTETLSGHRAAAARALADVPADQQTLAAWPDQDRANLGLFSPARQALVFRAAEARLLATLRDLKLAD